MGKEVSSKLRWRNVVGRAREISDRIGDGDHPFGETVRGHASESAMIPPNFVHRRRDAHPGARHSV